MSLLLLIIGCVAGGLLWQEVRRLREWVEMLEAYAVVQTVPAEVDVPRTACIPPEP
ncbi:hypothetical protein ACFSC3_12020 [Sphingomonas floccifaciens]|uniref:Uncharacterized protein n=1 Tax=Sphingomonas floccifaciens TaxID=1844115 RepID=A0ABW4NE61_9SPHN